MEKYIKKYEIRSYECDMNENLRLQTLFNLFQDMADAHANMLSIGYNYCVSHNLLWVGTNYEVEISRLPKWGETLEIRTWPSDKKMACAIRDFEIFDENGAQIIVATSKWAILNASTYHPMPVHKVVAHEPLYEHSLKSDFPKFQMPNCDFSIREFDINFSDVDVNHHVNNAIYPLWAQCAVPFEFVKANQISKISVAYKKSAIFGDKIKVESAKIDKTSYHKIVSSDGTKEFALVRFEWK